MYTKQIRQLNAVIASIPKNLFHRSITKEGKFEPMYIILSHYGNDENKKQ